MEEINLNYRKPQRCIDLVYRELGETRGERAITIKNVLWRYGFTIDQVNEALQTLEKMGKASRNVVYNASYHDVCSGNHTVCSWTGVCGKDEEE